MAPQICQLVPTLRTGEGPYYKSGAPARKNIICPKLANLIVYGSIFGVNCRVIPGAILDIWHAGPDGYYDLENYDYRGQIASDNNGYFEFATTEPLRYQNRTKHIHVKVSAPGFKKVTTQLFFPGESYNAYDPLFRPELLMRMLRSNGVSKGEYNFVLSPL